ncbi:hypothetical protein [Vibrio nigripulchritudo]|uniref:hypothetical protein n=1 Tax=Vibrio nigripulchritudo TaxID=28173 RepID=UPI0024933E9B|nr:hypothetical protein [Vibrio nigripulchritudo]
MLKRILATALFCSVVIATTFKFSVSEERLMLCALGADVSLLSEKGCYQYFYVFGVSPELKDIVQRGYGISPILSANTETRFLIAKQLISSGVDINQPNPTDGLNMPPIHSTILQDDLEGFNWLVRNGADLNIIYEQTGEDVLTFLNAMYLEHPTHNRQHMRELILNSPIIYSGS